MNEYTKLQVYLKGLSGQMTQKAVKQYSSSSGANPNLGVCPNETTPDIRSCAWCQAEKRPMLAHLAGLRSASTVRVHVCAGLPLPFPRLAMNGSVGLQSMAVVQLWASPGNMPKPAEPSGAD